MPKFDELNLKPELARAVKELGFETPTDIQEKALPVLMGKDTDYMGLAATGTGKTAAFGIPMLDRIDPKKHELQALVLCPTRELAIQTSKQLSSLGKYLGIEAPAIYGGGKMWEQIEKLRRAPVVVATPGRLIDHLTQGNVSFASVRLLVLDEADRMISMGFQEELEMILKTIPRDKCHTWMFSATMPAYLKKVVSTYLKAESPTTQVKGREVLSGTTRQIYFTVRDKNKPKGLCKIIDMTDDFYGLIFCQTKALVVDLTQYLKAQKYHVDSLHGDKEQRERERTLSLFRDRQVNILVCTDVAARGLDVQDLTHVINYSLPDDVESYIHRIGRTGRNGKEGIAMSFVGPGQMHLIPRIQNATGTKWEAGLFPSRKDVSVKKLARFLPKFDAAPGHDRALEVIDGAWRTRLDALSKEEIASRFLALALPDLFEVREEVEDAVFPSQERRAKLPGGPSSFHRKGGYPPKRRDSRFRGNGSRRTH